MNVQFLGKCIVFGKNLKFTFIYNEIVYFFLRMCIYWMEELSSANAEVFSNNCICFAYFIYC